METPDNTAHATAKEGVSDAPGTGRRRRKREHPTRTRLIETTRALLAQNAAENLTSDMVLEASGISKGSLYHHFEDFNDLIGTVMVREFSQAVQATIDAARTGFAQCDSAHALQSLIRQLTRLSQQPAMRERRMHRIRLILFAQANPRHKALLAAEQGRLTAALSELFSHAQDRGWINRRFTPGAAATLIQAYSTGRIVDDITEAPQPDEAWFEIIDLLTSRVFAPE